VEERNYLRHDGLGLAALVASGQVTPAELLEAARARTDAVDPAVNAVVVRLDDHADARVGGPPTAPLTGPFAGVPFLLKDLHQRLAGTRTTDGCRALAGHRDDHTSTVVQRWLDAGLVVFGRTNTPEFGSKGVTEPELFGPTRNPWDPSRTPGGSSGGAAAAVAAGIVPVAAASDGGGSIRIPAACTGLVGLKPGRGLVPFGPDFSEPLDGLASVGVVSRSVRDTAAMLDVLVGPDAMSPYPPALPDGPLLAEVGRDPGVLRIAYSTRCELRERLHPEAVRAVERAAGLLTDLGHHVEEVDPPWDDRLLARDFLAIWFVHNALEVARIKRETGAGDDGFELDTLVMAALGRSFGALELQEAHEHRHRHVAGLAAVHAGHDLLLTPTLAEPPLRVGQLDTAPSVRRAVEALLRTRTTRVLRHLGIVDEMVDASIAWVPFTQLANMTGRPAVSLPLHVTEEGLPLGVQLVAPLRGEALLLRVAAQLEAAAPWDHLLPLHRPGPLTRA
jgi:Asp-tRNA(Asn)/Glu-tRNA(Gln) amidotransferase A subunit family amidase